jgi:hypothetical protein
VCIALEAVDELLAEGAHTWLAHIPGISSMGATMMPLAMALIAAGGADMETAGEGQASRPRAWLQALLLRLMPKGVPSSRVISMCEAAARVGESSPAAAGYWWCTSSLRMCSWTAAVFAAWR